MYELDQNGNIVLKGGNGGFNSPQNSQGTVGDYIGPAYGGTNNAPMDYGAAQSYLGQQQLPNTITEPYGPVGQPTASTLGGDVPASASGSFFPAFKLGSSSLTSGSAVSKFLGSFKTLGGAATKANPYLAAASLGMGAISVIGGLRGLKNTKKPNPYSLDPKIQGAIGESEAAARYGLNDVQLSLARQMQSQNVNSAMYNARNTSAGSGSRAVFGGLQGMNMNAGNQLALNDFNAMQGKIRYRDQMYGQMQTIRDRNTAQDIDTYNRKQQAYGGAVQSGLKNINNFFNLGQAMRYNPSA
jgi:hypothetical protein